MQYLFDVWDDITLKVKYSKRTMLLLDYDGTLTPIVENPEKAYLAEDMKGILKSLSQKPGTIVGIISGRALTDLKNRINLSNVIYAGNHGLEIEGFGISFLHPLAKEIRSTLNVLKAILSKALNSIEGAFVEDKGLTLTVHYRQVENEKKEIEVKSIFDSIVGVARMLDKVKITSGKKVYEVRPPVSWDKGQAIKMILKKHGRMNILPIYLGDDLTDEDAFVEVKRNKGISVYIGSDNTIFSADYYLNTINEVQIFLERLNTLI